MKCLLYSTVAAAALVFGASAQAHPLSFLTDSKDGEVRHVYRHIPTPWDYDINRAEALRPNGDDFRNRLALEYRDLTRFEADQMMDWTDADYFAEKTLLAAAGKQTEPEPVGDWKIESQSDRQDLRNARNRLMTAFANGAKSKAPDDAAVAQVSYDCWIEQQEENWQTKDIQACRKQFEAAMGRVDVALRPTPRPVAQASKPKTEVTRRPVTEFVAVYFDFDKASLRPEAQREIDHFVDSIENKEQVEVVVVGHADRAGPADYNVDLSRRRADAVRDALVGKGLKISELKDFELEAKGESEPAVPTADGVPEPANRRVVVRAYSVERVASTNGD